MTIGTITLITLSILGTVVVLAAVMMSRNSWRQCSRCGVFFDDNGNESDEPPHVMNSAGVGVCAECCRILENKL
jgi:hypothetical protein